jgi:ABC-2 type transport system permease protein
VSALRSYRLLVIWQLRRARLFIPLAVVVQALLAVGIVLGYPLLFPRLDPTTTLFLATGAPTITLITMGLVLVPQVVAQAKTEGSLDYMRSLPVPRVSYLLADLTVWLAVVLPGVVFAIVVSAIRFGLDLHVSPLAVPALLLVALTSTSIGYAIASLLPPMLANLTTQVLVVFVLMFSPLTFPADRLPGWLAAVHGVLPIQAMGEVVRGTLAVDAFPLTVAAVVVLVAWCVASLATTTLMLTRRS